MVGVVDCALTVAPYPVAWRVGVVYDDIHRDFEYVRLGLGVTQCDGTAH